MTSKWRSNTTALKWGMGMMKGLLECVWNYNHSNGSVVYRCVICVGWCKLMQHVIQLICSLSSTDGLYAFRAFLVSEFSEENIAFYLACKDYKNTKSEAKLQAKAQRIYNEFIGSEAPREVMSVLPILYLRIVYYMTKLYLDLNLGSHILSSFFLSGQHWPWDSRHYPSQHQGPYSNLLRSSSVPNLHPDGKGLLPTIPPLQHLPWPGEPANQKEYQSCYQESLSSFSPNIKRSSRNDRSTEPLMDRSQTFWGGPCTDPDIGEQACNWGRRGRWQLQIINWSSLEWKKTSTLCPFNGMKENITEMNYVAPPP